VNLLPDFPQLRQTAGADGQAAFNKMLSLLEQNAAAPDGTLNLPANANPFLAMPGAQQGGLFKGQPVNPSGSVARDAQAALDLETQLEQQLAAVKSALGQIQAAASAAPAALAPGRARHNAVAAAKPEAFAYKAPLPAAVVARLEQQLAPYRAPQYDQTLQQVFWPHVYNELPGTGPNTDRLQVITGTNQTPQAVQITGTVTSTKLEPDGDLHISFQPDDPAFPTNQGSAESPLELEIIYAGPVTQADAKQAQQGYTNPFDISHLNAGVRIQAAGPAIFDRAHGTVDSAGNVQSGLEIHPLVGVTVLSAGPPAPSPVPAPVGGQLSADVSSAIAQLGTLGQSVASLVTLLQKMQGEIPKG
jgi:hypothetical protein